MSSSSDPTKIKYDPEITLTTIRSEVTANTLKFDDVNKSYEDNVWMTEFREKYGINVKYLWVADATQYDTKFNLMISSGDIPDFFEVKSVSDLQELMDNGMLADLSSAYAGCASDSAVKNYASLCSDVDFKIAEDDGKLYGIPHFPTGPTNSQMIYLRTDWLKKLGLSEPTSMSDIVNIAKAFAQDDPDGNGVDDTIGLYIPSDPVFDSRMTGIYNSYHAYPGIYIEGSDGNLVAGATTSEMKTALTALHNMYQLNAIPKDYSTIDTNKINEMFTNGKIGLWYGGFADPLIYLQYTKTADPNAVWKTYSIVSNDDDTALVQSQGGVSGYFVASSKCEHPEALLTLMNRFEEIRYCYVDSENEDLTQYQKFCTTADGVQIGNLSPISVGADFFGAGGVQGSDEYNNYFAEKITMDEVTPEVRAVIGYGQDFKDGDNSKWMWDFIYNPSGSIQTINNYYKANSIITNKYLGSLSSNAQKKLSIANAYLVQAATKIISGQEDISSYDAAVDQWNSYGGKDVLNEVNAWYEKYK